MSQTAARTRTRKAVGPYAVGLVVVTAAIIGTLLDLSASPATPSLSESRPPDAPGAVSRPASSSGPRFSDGPRGYDRGASPDSDGAITEADGALPEGVTVFEDELPGVANLDPELLGALREAATDAAYDGVALYVTSGWRSPEYQDQLFRQAVAEHGSAAEAARWVATADASPHVSGDAVDIGPATAAAWLSEHGANYGLCQIYRNEPWHFELRPGSIDGRCPRMYSDPTQDPRMQP